jgi:hypothetical protein
MTPLPQRFCPICGGEIFGSYATGRIRRYCSPICTAKALELWHRLVNRRWRLSALESPGCRAPEGERSEALARVRIEIADLEGRLGGSRVDDSTRERTFA